MVKSRFGARHGVVSFLLVAGLVVVAQRATANAPVGRFTPAGGMVFDTVTGLTWQQTTPAGMPSWSTATSYCTNVPAGLTGTGWRLPSLTELQTIVDDSQPSGSVTVDPNIFLDAPAARFWTSSTDINTPSQTWVVNFLNGFTESMPVASTYNVRCVR
jgi:Protein of unknown function (DUF1566)